jgi:hypothetical protein
MQSNSSILVVVAQPRPVLDIFCQKQTNLKEILMPTGAGWTQNTRVISACCSFNLVNFACVLMEYVVMVVESLL